MSDAENRPECQEQLAKLTERLLYLQADFENYRKKVEKERLNLVQMAHLEVLGDLLPVLDDLERARQAFPATEKVSLSEKARQEGVELIYKSLLKVLEQYDMQEIEATGKFDPTMHEALLQVNETNQEPGTIVLVLRKGYRCGDVILRPAQVSVAA